MSYDVLRYDNMTYICIFSVSAALFEIFVWRPMQILQWRRCVFICGQKIFIDLRYPSSLLNFSVFFQIVSWVHTSKFVLYSRKVIFSFNNSTRLIESGFLTQLGELFWCLAVLPNVVREHNSSVVLPNIKCFIIISACLIQCISLENHLDQLLYQSQQYDQLYILGQIFE